MSLDLSINYDVVSKRTGVVGKYSADEGMCVDEGSVAGAPKSAGIISPQFAAAMSAFASIGTSTPWYEKGINLVKSLWNSSAGGAAACGGPSGDDVIDHLGDGHIMTPTDAGVKDGSIPHPTDDAGNLIIGEGFIDPIESSGTDLIQGTGILAVQSGRIVGSGLQNADLEIRVATAPQSIQIEGVDQMGCFDGLINIGTLTAEEYANRELWGISGCPTPEYDRLWACPDDPNNRLPLYVAYYYMICYANGEPTHYEENRFFTPEQMLDPEFDPAGEQRIGTVCTGDASGIEPVVISVPNKCNETGETDIEFGYQAFINARSAVDATYLAPVSVTLNLAQGE